MKSDIRAEGVVTSRGQLVIPAELRRQYKIEDGTRVRFENTGLGILVRPITDEYIESVKGILADAKLPVDLERDPDRELR
jgi:AbrB family looped-hinge helix DNA binding protein